MTRWAEAVGDYKGTEKGQLSFAKGDFLEVVKQNDATGWWTMKLKGKKGLVSCAYIKESEGPKKDKDKKKDKKTAEKGKSATGNVQPPANVAPPPPSSPRPKRESIMVGAFDEADPKWNWGRISHEEAAKELLKDGREGTFLVRMSQTQEDTYTISVIQEGEVRHLRVLGKDSGYVINQEDDAMPSIGALIKEKMGQKIFSRLTDKEEDDESLIDTRLLRNALLLSHDDSEALLGTSFISGLNIH